jgi:DNA-binding MarR family transcriptional regulator
MGILVKRRDRDQATVRAVLRLRREGRTVLAPSHLRCLGAVLALDRETGLGVRFRDVAARLGVQEHAVQQWLERLRDAGLVTWEKGLNGTLRPRVAFLTPRELGLGG